ncbi:MAG: C40 family peptidase [Ignavibacteriales bacterium]|nr:C40 family peptidase [Ignavibacteriales bacterium]
MAVLYFSCNQWHCTQTSPRYTSSRTSKSLQPKEKKIRQFSSALKEEVLGDDKKVEIDKVKMRFAKNSPNEVPTKKNKQSNSGSKNIKSNESEKISFTKETREDVMNEVLSMLGVPYLWGGEDENGIDCSAFTRRVFQHSLAVSLPRTSREQMREGKLIGKSKLDFGDLVFFNTRGVIPSHVGIYLEDDLFAHASESFGVTISSLESSYYNSRFVGARRIVK